jgi:hypothetical protein
MGAVSADGICKAVDMTLAGESACKGMKVKQNVCLPASLAASPDQAITTVNQPPSEDPLHCLQFSSLFAEAFVLVFLQNLETWIFFSTLPTVCSAKIVHEAQWKPPSACARFSYSYSYFRPSLLDGYT